ncbi:MAG: hypothetical protein GWO16_00460 [Gammaproteobacteria bacterium]|nr:hypothetical protein [Gammaproteobacteria bacterium]NIR27949.1 hypothetical protein [Gammaproteobacteria bacterium]NIR96597.1 hypothetical protein [Gammaproteobacteria bacterium]NIT62321.1 hypothetical protein [Gammaproteobacteria bacterium]NIV19244.1 hypothetical protein [Gammaproteobacteria bacterium]
MEDRSVKWNGVGVVAIIALVWSAGAGACADMAPLLGGIAQKEQRLALAERIHSRIHELNRAVPAPAPLGAAEATRRKEALQRSRGVDEHWGRLAQAKQGLDRLERVTKTLLDDRFPFVQYEVGAWATTAHLLSDPLLWDAVTKLHAHGEVRIPGYAGSNPVLDHYCLLVSRNIQEDIVIPYLEGRLELPEGPPSRRD